MNRYQIIKLIRKDLTGGVYDAIDQQLDRKVAVRRFFTEKELINSNDFKGLFVRLRERLANFQHPGILTIFDADLDEDGPFLVSHPQSSPLLSEVLGSTAKLEAKFVYSLFDQMLQALCYLHKTDTPHGNISSLSVLCVADGEGHYKFQLVDVGLQELQKQIRGAAPAPTSSEKYFIAPELQAGQSASARSDLFSLAKIIEACCHYLKPEEKLAPHLLALVQQMSDVRADVRPINAEQAVRVFSGEHADASIKAKVSGSGSSRTKPPNPIHKTKSRNTLWLGTIAASLTAAVAATVVIKNATNNHPSELLDGSDNETVSRTELVGEKNPQLITLSTPPNNTGTRGPTAGNNVSENLVTKTQNLQNFSQTDNSVSRSAESILIRAKKGNLLNFTIKGKTTKTGYLGINNNALVLKGLSKSSKQSSLKFAHAATATVRSSACFVPSADQNFLHISLNDLKGSENGKNDQIVVRLRLDDSKTVTLLDTRRRKSSKLSNKKIKYRLKPSVTKFSIWVDVMTYGKNDGYQISKIELHSTKPH